MTVLICIIIGLTLANSFMLWLIYYFVNRNWEHIIDFQNQLNVLDKTIYHTYKKRGE